MTDIIEQIGRTFDAYRGLLIEPSLLEVSPEVDAEIKRLLRKRPEQVLRVLKVDGIFVEYSVNPKMVGEQAFKLHTGLGITPPEAAIRTAFANRSDAVPKNILEMYPKLKH